MAKRALKKKKRAAARKRAKPPRSGGSRVPKAAKSQAPNRRHGSAKLTGDASLRAELRAARDRQTASAEILRAIATRSGDPDKALRRIAEITARLFESQSVTIRTVGPDGKWGRSVRWGKSSLRVGRDTSAADLEVGGPNLPATALRENRQIHIPDIDDLDPSIAHWPTWPHARAAGIRSLSGTPLRREGKAIGALVVHRERFAPFSKAELELLQSFADQAVIAIENARLFNETKEALERQTATSDVLSVINSSAGDLAPVFDTILKKAHALCGVEFGSLQLYDGEFVQAVAVHGLSDRFADLLRRRRPVADAAPVHQPLFNGARYSQVVDAAASDLPMLRAVAEFDGIRTLLFIPLRKEARLLGAIVAGRREMRTFSEKEIGLLESFAAQAAIAIENARLLNETQEALERQTATADVLEVINSSPGNLAPVFEVILQKARELCGTAFGSLQIYDGEYIRAVAVQGTSQRFAELVRRGYRAAESPSGRAFLQGQRYLQIDDTLESDFVTLRGAAEIEGLRTVLYVPLRKGGRLLGTIAAARREVRPFSEKDIGILESFAAQAAIAIENARLINETREALERQTATADVLKVIASSPSNLQPVFDAIAERSNHLIGGHATGVVRYVGDMVEIVAFTPVSPKADAARRASFPRPITAYPIFELVRNGEVVQIPDSESELGVRAGMRDLGRARGFRSLLLTPLMGDTGPIGHISVTRKETGSFADHHVQLLKTFADQAVIAIQNVKLFEEVQARTRDLSEALDQQTATADVLKVISRSTFDLQTVLQTLVESAAKLCGSTIANIWLRDGEILVGQASIGMSEEFRAFLRTRPIRAERGSFVGRAFLTGEVVHLPDVLADPEYTFREFPKVGGFRAALGVPLIRDGRVEGVFALARPEPGPFPDRAIELVRTFADQAVIAIENVRLFNETREALERQTATADVLKVIASSPSDLQPVFDAIAERAKRLVGGHTAAVTKFVGDMAELAAMTPLSPEADATFKASFPRPLKDYPLMDLVSGGESAIVADMETDPRYVPAAREAARLRGFRSLLLMPLIGDSGAIGMISVTRKEPGTFADHHVQLLRTFADQAVIAIQNVKLFEEVQARTRDLQEALEQQTATADVLKVISRSTFDLQAVMDALTRSAAELCGADRSSLHLRDGDTLVVRGFAGTDDGALEFLRQNPFTVDDQTFTGRAVLTGAVANIGDAERVPGLMRKLQPVLGFKAILFVPLMREGRGIGLFSLSRNQPGAFTQRQIELVQTFADQAVIAIENTRLFNETTEALERQTATADVLKVIASSPTDLQPVFDAIAERSNRLLGGHATTVYRFVGETIELEAFTPVSAEADAALTASYPRPIASTPQFELVRDGKVAQIADADSENVAAIARATARARGWRSAIFAPLTSDSGVIGGITVTRKEAGAFAEHDVQLLQTFADQAVIAIQNVKLFEEVQARTRELQEALVHQTGSANILRVIASSPTDVGPVLKAIVESACELCDATDALLHLKDGEELRSRAHHGPIPVHFDRLPINRGWASGQAFLDRIPVHIHDILATYDEDTAEGLKIASRHQGKLRTVLAVPLLREGESIGIITLRRVQVQPFTDKQIALLQTFADQAVIAIENTRLFNETQEALERQTATADVLKVIASSPTDLQPVFDAIAERSNRLLGGHATATYRYIDGMIHLVAFTPVGPEADAALRASFPRPIANTPQTEVAHSGSIVQIADSEAEGVLQVARDIARARGWRSVLFVPLQTENGPIGAISVTRKEPGTFADHHVQLLKTFADQAVIAIQNVKLFEEVQARTRELSESLQFQTASSDVLKVISQSPDTLQPVLDVIVDTSRQLCGSVAATIFLQRDGKFHVAAESGAMPDRRSLMFVRANPISLDQRGSVLARAARLKRTVHVPNTADDPEFDQGGPVGIGGPRAVLAVPLVQDGQVIGGIVLPQPHTNPFTPRQIEAVETFADQAVIAISNVNLFEQVQQRTRELTQSLEDLRTAQDRLVQTEKLASLGQLTAGIAHEIKNPLNFVNNFSALSAELVDELLGVLSSASLPGNAKQEVNELTHMLKDNLDKVVQHGKRADSIVKNMLLHSRQGSSEHRPTEINALLDESLNLAYHGARAERPQFNVTLKREFDDAAGLVDVFPQDITRVFLNLISNGFYAVTKRKAESGEMFEPTVSASSKNLGDRVEIRIRDNGTGIPPEVREKLFSPFFTTKPAGEGTGLGLSISHDIIVKQHGGTIDVVTLPGVFTEFTIILPRANGVQPGRAERP